MAESAAFAVVSLGFVACLGSHWDAAVAVLGGSRCLLVAAALVVAYSVLVA